MTTRTTTTDSHYEQHSKESYESAYFYSPGAYMDHLRGLVVQTLQLSENPIVPRRLLDIGGGTGNFTQLLLRANPALEAIVVDPFLVDDNNSEKDKNPKLHFVQASAEAFAEDYHHASANDNDDTNKEDTIEWRRDYHHVLLKEVVHHLENRVAIFQGMRDGLAKDSEAQQQQYPHLLIMTRPQIEIDYPLWPAACHVWAANQPSHQMLTRELYQAGFSKVQFSLESYPCQISLKQWQAMVKRRFWSTFSNFTDEELEQACESMPLLHADRLDEDGNLTFEDRLVFLTAWK